MAIEIGRQGYIGFALEDTPGTPEASPDVFLPTTEATIELQHEKLMDISTRASRIKDHNSVNGKEWSEGDIAMYLDATNIGYLVKCALGNEVKTTVSADPAVDNHQFYVTASGNTAKTATVWNYRGDGPAVKRSTRMAIDSLKLEITNDDLATVTAAFMGGDTADVSAPTLTTTSGTVFTWGDTTLQFGDTVADARNATATKITNFQMEFANNIEMLYRSGSRTVDEVVLGEAELTGEYTIMFENDTELDAYKNNSKRAMVVTLTGADLGGVNEEVEIVIERMFLEDKEIETGQDSLYAFTGTFRAINDQPGQLITVNVQNGKTSVY